ncbi:hypothetical protein M0R04_11650 [Candidatus Dojkabacteria bacterium]|jgi:hypothetical protein|nr:hypothetical protein [Candidatus Dojkabacteria bacterium]
MNYIQVVLTPDVKDFIAKRYEDLTFYNDNRAFSKIADILVGVIGELGAYQYLRDKGYDVNLPNFEYTKNKTYAADFATEDGSKKFHVKSQSLESARRYGDSWLIQRNDRIVKVQPIIENEFIICCAVDPVNFSVRILLDKPVKDVVYNECKVPAYALTKVAIYLEDNKE